MRRKLLNYDSIPQNINLFIAFTYHPSQEPKFLVKIFQRFKETKYKSIFFFFYTKSIFIHVKFIMSLNECEPKYFLNNFTKCYENNNTNSN